MFLAITNTMSWIIAIVLGIVLGLLIASNKSKEYDKNIIYLIPEEFRLNMRKGQLLDIRKDEAYNAGHINGSRNFPKRSSFQNLHLLRIDQAVFLYGQTDRGTIRSVAKKFVRKGYKPIYVLKGGLKGWEFPLKTK